MEDYVIVWESPPIIKPEFRLYYDDKGNVLFYTCEKPEGNYIVIDTATYAEGRPDVKVVNGKLSHNYNGSVVSKLIPKDSGILCTSDDMSIIVSDDYDGNITKWELITYEL